MKGNCDACVGLALFLIVLVVLMRLAGPDAVNVVNATASSGVLPSLQTAPPKIKELLENDVKWEFDIIELETLTGRRCVRP